MWWGVHEGMGWWMLFGGIWILLFWGAIIGLIIWGIRALTGRPEPRHDLDDPLEIARRRYARGEITRAELEEIESTLRGQRGART